MERDGEMRVLGDRENGRRTERDRERTERGGKD